MKVTLVFDLDEDVTPERFAGKVTAILAAHGGLRIGESVIEPESGWHFPFIGMHELDIFNPSAPLTVPDIRIIFPESE